MTDVQISADRFSAAHAKTESKGNESQQLPQERFADFLGYLTETIGASMSGKGDGHQSINTALEAILRDFFSNYISGKDGDAIERYAYADTAFSVYLYNGKFYERLDIKKFTFLICQAMKAMDIGVVYRHKSSEPITKAVIEDMISTGAIWKPDSRYMVFRNGVLDTADMTLHDHNSEYQTNIVFSDLEYSAEADCPIFRQVVADALDADTANVLQEMCGYLLFPDSRHEKIGVLVGEGRNGKSVILKMISYALGEDNVSHFGLQQITESSGIYIANMVGKLANICYDSGSLIKIGNEGIFKQYASGEPLTAKILYQQPMITDNYPHSIIAVNALPVSTDFSDGYFRRFLIIDFPHQIPLNKVDRLLFEKMKPERMGVLLWIIEGMTRLLSESDFTKSKAVDAIKSKFRKDSDSVAMFVDECELRPSDTKSEPVENLFQAFKAWCRDNNHQQMTKAKFSERMTKLHFKKIKKSSMHFLVESDADLPA